VIHHSRRHDRGDTHHERRGTLLARLAEAEETLQALRDGDLDALVVRGADGDQVYTLHGAEEPYRRLVEQMREGAVVLGPTGEILYANAQFAALVGEPLESIPGGQIDRFLPDADRADFAVLTRSGSGTRGSRLIAGDGTVIEVYFSLTTTVTSNGTSNLSLIVTDVRELLQARHERDRAEHDSHVKNEFLAMLAHELRNPLGAIRSAVSIIDSVNPSSSTATHAREVIARQVAHLSRLIDDLLDVERVASGKIRLDRHPLDMAEALQRAVASVTTGAGLDRDIEIHTEPVWVQGDADRLEQVFVNLITNAIKYTPRDGSIQVSLSGQRNDAVLTVQDTGAGIASELLPLVFDMFVQGEHTLDRAQGGLGIGLTLVRRLVELHGGTVAASSDGAGRGSTFTVRVPRLAVTRNSASIPSPVEPALSRRILLIEDSRDAREMFRLVLEQAGHDVYEAASGDRGLELVETVRPEVAIIDIGLPGLDGYEIARRIRNQPHGRAMLLLALTGYGFPSDRARSTDAGFDHHLVKPVDPYALARVLDENAAMGAAGEV
jgi:PAS domain S-box-containing protein